MQQEKATGRRRETSAQFAAGQPGGQALRDGPDDGNAAPGPMKGGAGRNRGGDSEEGAGEARLKNVAGDDGAEHRQGDGEAGGMNPGHAVPCEKHGLEKAVAAFFHAEHPGQLADGDLEADPREKADQDGARKEIRQEAEPQDARPSSSAAATRATQAGERD